MSSTTVPTPSTESFALEVSEHLTERQQLAAIAVMLTSAAEAIAQAAADIARVGAGVSD
jgi:putative effector of murein hydrolase